MRQVILPSLLALGPLVLGQTHEEISRDEMLSDSDIEEATLITDSDPIPGIISLAATDLEAYGTRIDLAFAWSNRGTDDEKGYFMAPPNGKGMQAFPDLRLNRIEVDKGGPCHLVYTNVSTTEPPLPDGVEPWDTVERMSFRTEGGRFDFQGRDSPDGSEYTIIRMEHVYCGAEDSFQGVGANATGGTCDDAIHGDLSTDILTICCSGSPSWKPDVWAANDLDDYLRNALEGFNERGWPSSIMNTFATYNLEEFKPAHELKNQPFWEWQCQSMHDECSVDDLSDQDACPVDPKRATVPRALENLANMWVSSRTKFTEDALTEVIMTLPGITKSLFPVKDPSFNAPGDYGDSTWIMIAGGGLLAAPFPLVAASAAPAVGFASAVIGGIMWLVGLSLGPMDIYGAEEDPHFENFGSFSEGESRDWVRSIYTSYESVFNHFFVSKPSGKVDVERIVSMFTGGSLIPRDPASEMRKVDSFENIQDGLENTFLAPLVNLAWQRQNVFAIKLPKRGIEFWRHKDNNLLNPYGEDRTSVTYDPCGSHEGGDVGWRNRFRTAKREDPTSWSKLEIAERVTCNSDGTGYAFFGWDSSWEKAYADYGFDEMDKRSLKLDRIIKKAEASQNTFGFNGGVAETWDEKLEDLSNHAGPLMNDPSALEFWNIPICDLTQAHDTEMGVIGVGDCKMKYRGGVSESNNYLDEYVCINSGMRDWCNKHQKDKNGNDWPLEK